MNIELHILQNFAPSCLNRDDTNTPKDCTFGGHRRARISSQCVKRSVRRYFAEHELLNAENLGERTKRLASAVAKLLVDKGRDSESATKAAQSAVDAVLPKSKIEKDEHKTPYLLYLAQSEIIQFAELTDTHFDTFSATQEPSTEAPKPARGRGRATRTEQSASAAPADFVKSVGKLLNGGKAADVALFGRMLADLPENNVHAACQVAHALSTNRVEMEMDYYTAVDDLKPDDMSGADMLGTTEFNSACFYRYSNIQLGQLTKNLGNDHELALASVKAYLEASVNAIPTGKQNSTAAQNPPSLVFAVVRKSGLWSLANAFEKPVKPDHKGGLVQHSIVELEKYWAKLSKAYGEKDIVATAIYHLSDDVKLESLKKSEVDGLDALIAKVLAALPKGAK